MESYSPGEKQEVVPQTLGVFNVTNYPQRNLRFYLAIASISLVCLASTIDLVILASALPVVSSSMGATSTEAYWCGTGFLISQAISQPIYCAFQNTAGHKECMLIALGIFGIASILCATADNMVWLIAARVLQGVGVGGCNAMVNVLIADLTPLKVRGIYLGITQLTAAVGLVAGIIMGAAFSTLSTWRLIFWINIPICVLSSAGIFFCIRAPVKVQGKGTMMQSLGGLDWGGVVLLTGSLLALLYGVTTGGVLKPWGSAHVIAPIAIGACGLVAFAIYELRYVRRPMIRIRLFGDRTVASGFFTAWAHGVIDIALAYYLIFYFLIGRLHPLLYSSLEITPGLASIPFWAAMTGVAMAFTSRFKWFNIAAWIFLGSGVGSLALLTPTSSLAAAYGCQLVLAVGSGVLYPGRILAVQAPLQGKGRMEEHTDQRAEQTREDISVATTLVSVFTSFGNAFGVGLGGVIVQNQWDKMVTAVPEEYRIPSSSLERSLAVINANKWPSEVILTYQSVLCSSLATLWIFAAALGGIGLVSTLFQRDIRLQDTQDD